MKKSDKNQEMIIEFKLKAKSYDWDTLAYQIMMLEKTLSLPVVNKKEEAKLLNLLRVKLEIFEEEKAKRVSDKFDYEYFITKNEFDDDEDYYYNENDL